VAGGSAEQTRVFALGSLDGIKGGGADDQDAHGSVKAEFSV